MRLVDCFIPLMAYVRHFQRQPGGDVADVKDSLDALIAESRRTALAGGFSDADASDALFAVVAWADEILLATPWAGAEEWKRQLLQRRHFNVTNAGVAFFTRLENLGAHQLAVREVYVYCLSMGFAGRYGHDRSPKALADVRQASLQLIADAADHPEGADGKKLFPEAYAASRQGKDGKDGLNGKRWGWKMSSLTLNILLVPLVILLVLYGIYHVIVWQTVNAISAQIR